MQQVDKPQALRDAELLRSQLGTLPAPVARPLLVVVGGLPGSGKSHFSHKVVERVPLLALETDALRKQLFGEPMYSAAESARLFQACHQLIYDLLKAGIPVLFDATNLVEAHREHLYHIADQLGVKLVLVFLTAPPDVVHARLKNRLENTDREDHSTAGPEVYERMRTAVEPVKRNHFLIDSSRDIGPVVEKVVREIKRGMRPD